MKIIAKPTFLIILAVVFWANSDIYAQDLNKLDGKWNLVAIETDSGKIEVADDNLYLIVSAQKLKFNLDVNRCWTDFQIKGSKIIYEAVACTEICCDKKYRKLINYTGSFKVSNQKLIIVNEIGTYYLNRIQEE